MHHPNELTRATAAGLMLRRARLEVTAAAIRELAENVSASVARQVAAEAANEPGWTGHGRSYRAIAGMFPGTFSGG